MSGVIVKQDNLIWRLIWLRSISNNFNPFPWHVCLVKIFMIENLLFHCIPGEHNGCTPRRELGLLCQLRPENSGLQTWHCTDGKQAGLPSSAKE